MKKASSPMKQMIKESLKEMRQDTSGQFPTDPTLEEDGEIRTGPERFAKTQKQKDEVVIDKLLAPIQNKSGYFMKLKKELRPGEWMLMKTIENEWRNWPDIEAEVAKIVKEHTKKAPAKWGSGPYRIEYACTSGIRGENYPNVDMTINAEEEYLPNPAGTGVILPAPIDAATAVSGQIDTLANLVGMLKNFLPQATDPVKTQDQIASAFKEGMALKVTEGANSSNLMATMMTGLIGMMTAVITKDNSPKVVNPNGEMDQFKGMLETLKAFGVLGTQQHEKPKSTIDFLTELKALGMDLFKKEDPIQQMTQLKQLASIAGEFMGMGGSGEKPGILEKIVDTLAPVIPGMIKDLKETANSATQAQIEAGRNIERARITTQQPQQGNTMNVGTGPATNPVMNNPQIAQFFAGLYEAVNMNNRMFYPVIYTSLLQDAQGQALLQGIANGTHTAKEVIELLQQHGGEKYKDSEFVMKRLVGYTNGFIMWIREMMKPKPYGMNDSPEMTGHENIRQPGEPKPVGSNSYDAECPLCHTIYAFESERDFVEEEDKTCEVMHNGVLCPGILQPMQKAS
jgi:hypothetical protein